MSKGFWGVIIIVILIFGGIFVLGNHKTANAPSKSAAKPTQHIIGQGKSGVTVVEYGDYQCPFCGNAYAPVKQAVTNLDEQIFFQFRNFPLTSLHQNAFAAARAAEAAGIQNKFLEMHDALYENQDQWSKLSDPASFFNQLAKALGLNLSTFKTDYASGKVNDLINADIAEGNKLKITGTPTFFINGKQTDLQYAKGAAAVEKIINDAIASKKSSN